MNKVTDIYESLTDEQVIEAVKELEAQENHPLGVLKSDGVIRMVAQKTSEIVGLTSVNDLFMASLGILNQAAKRYVILKEAKHK